MTDQPTIPRLALAQAIVNHWAKAFGIDDWRIDVVIGRDLNGAGALCHVTYNYDSACIEVQPWVVGLGDPPTADTDRSYAAATDDAALEELLVHELLHALFRRRTKALVRLGEQLPESLRDAFDVLRQDADEEIVDRLARVLVRVSGKPGCESRQEAVRW